MGRRRTQQTARHCVKCRSHEHRHVERTLLARNPSVSGHVHPRVGIDSNTNQYELGRLSRSLSRGSDSSRPSVLPANPPLAGCGSFGLHGSSSVLHARKCVVCRRLLKYLFFFFSRKKKAPQVWCEHRSIDALRVCPRFRESFPPLHATRSRVTRDGSTALIPGPTPPNPNCGPR